jgi:hypothetical protein
MNCSEFKIWTETAAEEEILSVNTTVSNHINNCSACHEKLILLQSSVNYMNTQKSLTLSDIKVNELINLLSDNSYKNRFGKNGAFNISRLAIAAIIIFGMLAGSIAGGLISTKSNSDNTIWNNEFTLLSDNSATDSYVFD